MRERNDHLAEWSLFGKYELLFYLPIEGRYAGLGL